MARQKRLQKNPSTTVADTQNLSESLQTRPFAPVANSHTSSGEQGIQAKADSTTGIGHSFGNLAVSPPTKAVIQPKLTIGQPGDKYEQEADRVAADVVQQINQPEAVSSDKQQEAVQRQEVPEEEELQMKPLADSIQRDEMPEEEELQMKPLADSIQRQEVPEEELQMKPLTDSIQRDEMPEEEELQMKSLVQRREAIDGGQASTDLESSINSARGGGQSLDSGLQRSMGQAMGADFSGVRVHTDAKSDQLNQSIQAKAFTTGQDIFFRQGEYNPESKGGQELLAHELTHVVQQQPQMVQMDKDSVQQDKNDNPPPEKQDLSWVYDTLKQLKSWNAIKDKFISNELTMRKFVEFRKSYVDDKINELRKQYPTLIAKSVGSKDLSSDYDITISTPETGEDVEAVDEFNNLVKSEFGVQPGTLFDTNLYAKDFLQVKENIKPDAEQQKNDSDLAQPEDQEFGKLTDLDQDVAALIKQRRFMNQAEWDKYTKSVVSGITDKKQKQAVLKQYEEADAIYQISAHELLAATQKGDNVQNKKGELGKEEQDELAKVKDAKVRKQVEQQLLGLEDLNLITHDNPDLVLEKSNQLYIDRMRQVRVLQCLIQNPEEESNIDAMKSEVKKLLGEACFFASEAYHSEGAVKHVVAGLQGDNAKAALEKLTPENILQSYNEQLGDFLKDIVHYTQAKAHPGKVFYRSSKYLYRIFDAVKEIKKRPEFADIQLTIGDENFLAAILESGLVAIRKGDIKFKDEVTKNEESLNIIKTNFGVDTAEGLKQKVLQMSVEFNQKVRNKLSFLADKDTEKQYFNNIQVK